MVLRNRPVLIGDTLPNDFLGFNFATFIFINNAKLKPG